MANQSHPPRDIPIKTFIRFWLVMVGFIATVLIVYLTRDALLIIGLSAFLAIALNPPVSAIANRLPGKSRVGATALAYILVVVALGLFAFTVVPTITEQMSHFIKTLPGVVENFSQQTHWLNDLVTRYGLESQYNDTLSNIQHQASQAAADVGGSFVSGVASIVSAFVTTVLIVVITFLMLIEGPLWLKRIWGLYKNPTTRDHHHAVVKKMYRVITGYVNGQVLLSAISATCSLIVVFILCTIFDIPANIAVPIAVIVFMTGLIPMFGATIGAIIAAFFLAINDVGAAIIFLIYYIIYQQIENNFLSPLIQSKTVEISALTVLVALTFGLSLFGLIGGLISIPLAGCIRVLVLDYIEQHKAKQSAS